MALAGGLKSPRHRAGRIAKPVAHIEVRTGAAWHRLPAAAVLQGIVAARLKLRRHLAVAVAQAIPLIKIVAVAARRRMTVTPVSKLMEQRTCGLRRDRR